MHSAGVLRFQNTYLRPSRAESHIKCMSDETITLQGWHVRLEPLRYEHIVGLVTAAAGDPALYRWSPVPQGRKEAERYVETALAWQAAGTAVPFAIVRMDDNTVIGSTRFWNIERWAWPP